MPKLKISLHAILSFVAVFVLLIAMALSLARALTPLLNQHKDWFENLATRVTGQLVKVEEVNASFRGIFPQFDFKQVTIFTTDQTKPVLYINNLSVGIDIFRTALNWRFVASSIVIDGVTILSKKDNAGRITVNGQNLNAGEDLPLFTEDWLTPNAITTLNWILVQRFIRLKNITFSWEQPNQPNITLTNLNFILANNGNQHRLRSVGGLLGNHTTLFNFNADLTGDINRRASWFGSIYWQSEDLPFGTLLADKFPNLQINHGKGHANVWLKIKQGNLSEAQAQLNLQELNIKLQPNQIELPLTELKGNLFWQLNDDGSWSVATKDLQWMKEQSAIRLDDVIFTSNKNNTEQRFYWPQLNLPELMKWLTINTWVSAAWIKELERFKVQGQLKDLMILQMGAWQDLTKIDAKKLLNTLYARTDFEQLSFTPVDNMPGATNLSGQIIWRADGGKLTLNSQQGELNDPSIFTDPLPFTKLTGDIFWQQYPKLGLKVIASNFQFSNAAIKSLSKFNLFVPVGKDSSNINLFVTFNQSGLDKFKTLVPTKILDPNLVNWLNQAFIAGDGISGKIVMRGKLADFPYEKAQGQFIADTDVKNATLNYAPGWPYLTALNGHLRFDPIGMHFNVASGKIVGYPVQNTSAEIPFALTTKANVVNVHTELDLDASDVINFTQTTPLQNILTGLRELQGHGKTELNLDLHVPLAIAELDNIQAKGKLKLIDNALTLSKWDIILEHINGVLNFTTAGVWSDQFSAELFNHPANIQIQTIKSAKESITRFLVASEIDIPTLAKRFDFPLFAGMQGKAAYKGILDLPGKSQQQLLHIDSNLQGIAIDLPKPYGKAADEKHDFSLDANFTDQTTQLNFRYPPQVAVNLFYGSDENQESNLQRGVVSLGEMKINLPKQPGLLVTGFIPVFTWSVWQPYYQKYIASENQANTVSNDRIDIGIGKINVFNQEITNAIVNIQRVNNKAWQGDIVSDSVIGRIVAPDAFPKQALKANFRYLYLNPFPPSQTKLKTRDIFPIQFSADEFRYGERKIKGISLNLTPNKNGNTVKINAAIESSLMSAEVDGTWKSQGQGDVTKISGSAHLLDLGTALKDVGISEKLVNGKGDVSFELTWLNSPLVFDGKTLSGSAKLKLTKGIIVGLDQNTNRKLDLAKVINLLSIDNILRRLSLNFSDLAHRGYNFNSWTGSYKFMPGKIETQDTYIDGPVASIYMSGDLDLNQEQYNLKLKINPHVNTTLPAMLAFIGGPIVGVAALAVNQILNLTIEKAAGQLYLLTGPWNDPHLEKLAK